MLKDITFVAIGVFLGMFFTIEAHLQPPPFSTPICTEADAR